VQRVYGPASPRVHTTAITALLRCRRRRGLPLAALAYQAWLQLAASGQALDSGAYLAGISACACAGRPQEAEALLPPLCAAAGAAGGSHVVAAHNVLLRAAARAGDAAGARRQFAAMRARGVPPDAVTYNTLAAALAAAGEGAPRARAVLEHARREGVPPDAYGLTAVMRAHATAGELAAAGGVLQEMLAAGVAPTAVTYGVLVDAHVRAGDLAGACALVGRLEGGVAAWRRRQALWRRAGAAGGGAGPRREGEGQQGEARGVGAATAPTTDLPAPTRIMYNTLLRGIVAEEWGGEGLGYADTSVVAGSADRQAGAPPAPQPTADAADARAAVRPARSQDQQQQQEQQQQQQQQQQQRQREHDTPSQQAAAAAPRPRGLVNRPQWTQPPASLAAEQQQQQQQQAGGLDASSVSGFTGISSIGSSPDDWWGLRESGDGGEPAGTAASNFAGNAGVDGDAFGTAARGAPGGAPAVGQQQLPGVWSVEEVLRRMAGQGLDAGTDTYSLLLDGMLRVGGPPLWFE
jgi:hypothetical protein